MLTNVWSPAVARVVVAAVPALLLVYPPMYAYLHAGWSSLFGYVRGDALLYLTIARHSQVGPFSFDGTTPTNGFHPLWQWILSAAFAIVDPRNQEAEQLLSLALCSLSAAAGHALASLAILRLTGSIFLALLPVPGAYFMAIGAVFGNQDAWHAINGMESGLSVLFGGLALYIVAERTTAGGLAMRDLVRPGWKNVFVRLGAITPLMVLARLDDIFLVAGLVLTVLVLEGPLREKLRTAFWTALPTAVTLAAYLAYNHVTAGSAMPLSGATKTDLSLPSSLYVLAVGLFPPILDLKSALTSEPSHGWMLSQNAFRVLQMLYPAAFVASYFAIVRARFRREPRFVVPLGLGLGVVLKSAYNLALVHLWHQGPWYYSFAILFCSFLTALLLGEVYPALARETTTRRVVYAFFVAFTLLSAGRKASSRAYAEPSAQYAICRDAAEISRALAERAPGSKVIEFDDGVLGFCLEQSTLHGFGFATDLESFRALQGRRLLSHAFERGFDVIASAEYIDIPAPVEGSDAIRALLASSFLEEAVRSELHAFDFELVYHHAPSHTAFFRFRPRPMEVVASSATESSPAPASPEGRSERPEGSRAEP